MKEFVFGTLLGRWPALIQGIRYFKKFHRIPDFRNPKDIYEILVNRSLDPELIPTYARLADKYAVREYVAATIGEEHLTPLLGHYTSPSEIDFDALPASFVLKTTNGCATNIIVKDKSKLDRADAIAKLEKWMKMRYGRSTGEPHYTKIPPAIIAEEFISDPENPDAPLNDYKFYCIDGKPYYMFLCANRQAGSHRFDAMIYDMDWREHPEYIRPGVSLIRMPRPANFDKLKEVVAKLAAPFKFLRVDFYLVGDKPIFGELTFTPGIDRDNYDLMRKMGEIARGEGI